MKRWIAAGAATAVIAAGAGSFVFVKSETASAQSSGPVEITFWNGHPSGALKKEMHQLVAEFNKTHPNIHVND